MENIWILFQKVSIFLWELLEGCEQLLQIKIVVIIGIVFTIIAMKIGIKIDEMMPVPKKKKKKQRKYQYYKNGIQPINKTSTIQKKREKYQYY